MIIITTKSRHVYVAATITKYVPGESVRFVGCDGQPMTLACSAVQTIKGI